MHPLVSLRNASLSVCRARSTAPLFCTRARIVTPWTTERDNATLHSRPQNRNALHQLQAQRWAHSGASSTRDVTHATALVYSSYGKPAEVLKVLRHTLEPPTEDSVQVQFLASPINPADINQVEGVYPLKPAMTTQLYGLNKQGSEQDQPPVAVGGNEGVAKVIKVGANAKAYYDVGDLVVMGSAGLGTWRSHGNFLANELTKVRTAEAQRVQTSKIDNVQLATITVNPCTAYRMLRDFKTLSPGDFIIQNGANSGVGEAVIQMAKALGVHTINIIRSRPGHELVAERLKALGATHILLDEQLGRLETKEQVKSWTGSKGQIKLGFNC
ncbi:mitochondrial 2-enoyl thioester reductase, partial [Lunasporangiospora selenospora]